MTIRDRLASPALTALAIGVLGLALTACSGGGDGNAADTDDTVGPEAAADLLGPEDAAMGEPVKIGMVADGATAAYDNTDELRAAEATADYYNDHHGGVGGRPIELVTCETGGDPATATDCANRLITEGVVAVAVAQSAVLASLWEPLHTAGVPTFIMSAAGEQFEQDDESTFVIFNSLAVLSLPIAVAEDSDAELAAFASIDVPQATGILEGPGAAMMDAAELDSEITRIPIGTADMTSQMQQIAASGAGVTEVVGNDAFCIAAFQGLEAVSYEGEITVVSQCITDATRDALPGQLEGINITSNFAIGATDDPSYQQYLAVMETYGDDVTDIDNATSVGGYGTAGALFAALAGITGDITPKSVIETIKSMDEAEVPAAGGITFRCGGSAYAAMPSVCTNQILRTKLDAEGLPTTYTLEDATDLLP
jgi:branched-chain amino acid transport system substrate-binding protein